MSMEADHETACLILALREDKARLTAELAASEAKWVEEFTKRGRETAKLERELGSLHGKIGLLANELTTISDNAPTENCLEAIRHSFRAMLAIVDVVAAQRNRAEAELAAARGPDDTGDDSIFNVRRLRAELAAARAENADLRREWSAIKAGEDARTESVNVVIDAAKEKTP